MVTCTLVGRTANQLFQIANVISYAKQHDMDYWIPQGTVNNEIWPMAFKHFPQRPPGRPAPHYHQWTEPDFTFTPIPHRDHIHLNGYYQSYKYIDPAREEILKAFQFPYRKLDGYVSIHVRRGDYFEHNNKHPVQPLSYYMEAIDAFFKKGYRSFIVCSDDIAWCKEKFVSIGDQINFSFSDNQGPIEDLTLMSCCEHNIIANSSFSWMAAWFNQNPDKKVIAPATWFGPGNAHLNTKDLIPQSWLTI